MRGLRLARGAGRSGPAGRTASRCFSVPCRWARRGVRLARPSARFRATRSAGPCRSPGSGIGLRALSPVIRLLRPDAMLLLRSASAITRVGRRRARGGTVSPLSAWGCPAWFRLAWALPSPWIRRAACGPTRRAQGHCFARYRRPLRSGLRRGRDSGPGVVAGRLVAHDLLGRTEVPSGAHPTRGKSGRRTPAARTLVVRVSAMASGWGWFGFSSERRAGRRLQPYPQGTSGSFDLVKIRQNGHEKAAGEKFCAAKR